MSENQYPPTKPVCQLDADNLYLHQTVADLDPLAADGSYLLPAGCIDTQPPEARTGFAARWLPEENAWLNLGCCPPLLQRKSKSNNKMRCGRESKIRGMTT